MEVTIYDSCINANKKNDCHGCVYGEACDVRQVLNERYQQGKSDGIREFAEWLSNTEYVANHDSFILPLRGYFTIDEIVKEFEERNSN